MAEETRPQPRSLSQLPGESPGLFPTGTARSGGEKKWANRGAAPEPAVADPLDEKLEHDWKLATVHETLRRIGKRNEEWRRVLQADLERGDETDQNVATRLGRSLESFRGLLKRARAAFRETYPLVEERLSGFSGTES